MYNAQSSFQQDCTYYEQNNGKEIQCNEKCFPKELEEKINHKHSITKQTRSMLLGEKKNKQKVNI